MKRRWVGRTICAVVLIGSASLSGAAVRDVMVTDVTTRAFSVVWASDIPVAADEVSVRVFDSDAQGNPDVEITDELSITVLSDEVALLNGVVKVDVAGLLADHVYYVTAHTDHAGGDSFVLPASGPGLIVQTAVLTTKIGVTNAPIVNDLILHQIPESGEATAGTLLIVAAPGVSPYPVTAFLGSSVESAAIVDLNNLFDVSGISAEIEAREVLQMTWYRGRKCPGLADHRQLTFRRAPEHTELPAITELEEAPRCFFADTFCDGVIDISDYQRVLNVLDEVQGGCRFNPDLDVFADGAIDFSDLQRVLNRLDQVEPFD